MNRRQFSQALLSLLCYRAGSPVMAIEGLKHGAGEKPVKKGTGFVFDDIYLKHVIAREHPESPLRLESVMQGMESTGLIQRIKPVTPLQHVNPRILKIHTKAHFESIRHNYSLSHHVASQAVAGALGAVRDVCQGHIKNAFCAIRPPGHHARNTGKEEGFCYYNTVAIAARYAQQAWDLQKILIVDWDYHHGNGTEEAFYSDPSVLFFSTHDLYAYPGTGHPEKTGEGAGKGFNINVHLGCGTKDQEIIKVFEERLLPAARNFEPDMILISAGFDSRESDLLGCFDLTDSAFVRMTKMLMELADHYCVGRIVSLLEGGYTPEGLSSAVTAHVKTLLDG